MSTKKTPSASKKVPLRGVTPNRGLNPSSSSHGSTLTPSGSRSSLNKLPRGANLTMTAHCSGLQLEKTLVQPSKNLEMECEFVYNEYLQELMRQSLMRKSIKSHLIHCNDQLEETREIAEELRNEERCIKNKIDDIERCGNLTAEYNKVRQLVEDHLKLFNAEEDKHITACNEVLKEASNKLYLKNVIPFQTQDDYDKFEKLMVHTKLLLERFRKTAGDIEGIQKLADSMRYNAKLVEQLVYRNKIVQSMQYNLIGITLEKGSDMLAD